jgi:hypothetical protein
MAKVAPEQQALHGRDRRPRRDPSGKTQTFHLRPVFHGFAGVLGVAIGAFFIGFPIYGLFTPGFYSDFHTRDVWLMLLIGGGALVFAWMGIRQFRNGAQVSGHELTIRNELRTYRVDAADIRAITLQPKNSQNGPYWVAQVELTGGKSIWIDNFECGPVPKPPRPDRLAAVEEVRALLGLRADDMGQPENQPQSDAEDAEAERLLAGMMADSKAPAVTVSEDGLNETQAWINHMQAMAEMTPEQEALYALNWNVSRSELSMPGQLEYDRLRQEHPAPQRELTPRARGWKHTVSEDGLNKTQAQINHIEAIIRKSLRWIDGILCLFLVIALPDSAAGETDVSLPTWLWWGIGIAGVMLALTVLAFRTNVPRRMAVRMVWHLGGH